MRFLRPAFVSYTVKKFSYLLRVHIQCTHTANRRITDPLRAKQNVNV